jgi:tungstate transport system ATP-binding protein
MLAAGERRMLGGMIAGSGRREAGPPIVELEGVRVARGSHTILEIPALDVRRGEVLVAIGPNGAGKSTLTRVLGLLETPVAGVVRFGGAPVSPQAVLTLRRRTAAAFQEPLLADTTVFDNVAMGLRFRGAPRAAIGPRVTRWLERLGLAALGSRQARTLSGGEAQRTSLARALAVDPELLLLDEPFAALDQPTREALIADLAAILRQDRTTTVLVTHERAEALALGDRIAVLIGGRLAQVGDAPVVFRAPVSEDVARFVGIETLVDCLVVRCQDSLSVLRAGDQTVEVAQPAIPGHWVRLCVRPEDVTVTPAASACIPSSARNHLLGRVARLGPSAGQIRVLVDCGFPLVALVTHRSVADLGLREGAAIVAHFNATAGHLLPARQP